ncbi:MAG TPA: alpha/beta fold hydrolase [Anaerolineales bacterium]|nr:alpha/beta fold hydrolase [Anaerolineales bacterium]
MNRRWILDVPTSLLESVTPPTLLVWGEKDRIVPFNGARTARFIEHLPHARVHFLPSLGHLPQVESPHEFNAVIREFLSD